MRLEASDKPKNRLREAPGSVNVRLLEIFLAVCREGSMKAAADRLELSQASISQSITALEQSLRLKLFERSVRPPTLTMDGERVLRHAREITGRIREFEDDIRGAGSTLPRLRIGMINSFTAVAGAVVFRQLRHVVDEWAVVSAPEYTRIQSLLERKTEVIVTSDDSDVPEEIEVFPILSENFVVAVPPSYPKSIASLKRIATDLDFIRFGHSALMAPRISAHLTELGVMPTPRYHFDTPDVALNLVAAGLGWAIATPLMCLRSGLDPSAVRLVELKPAISRRLFVAMRRSDRSGIARSIHAAALVAWRESILPRLETSFPGLVPQVRVFDGAGSGTKAVDLRKS